MDDMKVFVDTSVEPGGDGSEERPFSSLAEWERIRAEITPETIGSVVD